MCTCMCRNGWVGWGEGCVCECEKGNQISEYGTGLMRAHEEHIMLREGLRFRISMDSAIFKSAVSLQICSVEIERVFSSISTSAWWFMKCSPKGVFFILFLESPGVLVEAQSDAPLTFTDIRLFWWANVTRDNVYRIYGVALTYSNDIFCFPKGRGFHKGETGKLFRQCTATLPSYTHWQLRSFNYGLDFIWKSVIYEMETDICGVGGVVWALLTLTGLSGVICFGEEFCLTDHFIRITVRSEQGLNLVHTTILCWYGATETLCS